MKRKATLSEVAKLAGVSAQTVSRVVNHFEGVKPSTRERVEQALVALNYHQNAAARTLATNESRIIGVVTSESDFYGPASTLTSIEQTAREFGYITLLSSVTHGTGTLVDQVNKALERGVDGLVIIANRHKIIEQAISLNVHTPTIIAGANPFSESNIDFLYIDQESGASAAIRHLHNLGHSKITFLSGPLDWVDARQRLDSVRSVSETLGIQLEVKQGDWSGTYGSQFGKEYLDTPVADRSSAVFAANDEMAFGFIQLLSSQGYSIPNDCSVVGFDDTPYSRYFVPPLTTVRQNFAELGDKIIQALLSKIQNTDLDLSPVAPSLIVRESTKRIC